MQIQSKDYAWMNQYLISQLAKAHGRKILALNLAFNHPRTPYFKEKNRPIDRYKQMSISTQIKLINNQEKSKQIQSGSQFNRILNGKVLALHLPF